MLLSIRKKRKTKKNKEGKAMNSLALRIAENESKYSSDWPERVAKPTDEDLEFLADLSARETGSDFFEKKKRSGKNE